MTKKEPHPDESTELRKQAEERVRTSEAQALESLSPEEARRVLHELQVRQIELEIQNDELRRAQAELEASRAQYFDLYDMAPVGYFTLSEKGLIIEGNLTAANLLGVERSLLIKQPLTRFILPEDQDAYYVHRKQLFETHAPQACEFRMIRADATTFWAHIEAALVLTAGGEPSCRAVVHDITGLKQAAEAVKLNELRLQALLELHKLMDASQEQILSFVLDAILKMAQSQFAFIGLMDDAEAVMTIHSWSRDAMAYCAIDDPPRHFPIAEAGIWGDCVRQRQSVLVNDYDAAIPNKKGYPAGHVPIKRFLGVPIFDGDRIVAVAGAANKAEAYADSDCSDLTLLLNKMWEILRRKKAEAALGGSEEQLRLLLDSTGEAIYGIDTRGNCTFCNPACLRLLGYERSEDLLGKNMHWQIHHKRADGSPFPVEECRIFAAFQRGEGCHVDNEVLWRADGTCFPAEYWSRPQLRDGAIVGAVVTFVDITERKQVEAVVERAHRALRVLSETNTVLLKATDEDTLMRETCRILTEIGGYRLSWIGLAEHDEAKSVRVAAQQGFSEGYLDSLKITWDDTEHGRGPTGTAIRTGQVTYFTDFLNDPRFVPWRERARQYGYACSIAMPLIVNGEALGALSVYGDTVGVFDDDEIAILRELTGNLCFGLQALRTRAERDRATAAERERLNALNCLYAIAALVERPGISLAGILQGIVEMIPASLQYPELTGARIVLKEQVFKTPNFQETAWMHACDIAASGQSYGRMEVCYLGERPAGGEGPFQEEELRLFDAIAERAGRIVQREQAIRDLAEAERLLRMEREMSASETDYRRARNRIEEIPPQPAAAPEPPGPASARTVLPASPIRSRRWGKGAAWFALAVSLLLTAAAWNLDKNQTARRIQDRFDYHSREIESGIRERLLDYESGLRSGTGLFSASEDVTREEWRTYVEALHIAQHYPGIQGIGFSQRISPSEKEAHILKIRGEGFPQYSIRPEGDRPEYTSIVYLEPFDARNQRAFGFDMFSEPVRREAMERARDTGLPVASGKVTLVQETDQDVQAGFLMYVPVYRNGASKETPEQRREALAGYVYAPFRMGDLMRNILREDQEGIEFQVFDGDQPLDATLMYSNGTGEGLLAEHNRSRRATRQSIIEFDGHSWLLTFAATPDFAQEAIRGQATTILGLGLLASVLLFGMVRSLAKSRDQAVVLADTALDMERANAQMRKEVEERRRAQQTLDQYSADLKTFNEAMLGRESRVIELKEEVNRLYAEMGRELPYPPVWRDTAEKPSPQDSISPKGEDG